MCAPKMWTGRPSADASSWLSAVAMQQEGALETPAERAARSNVLVISRTMPSSRLAITNVRIGSTVAVDGPEAGGPKAGGAESGNAGWLIGGLLSAVPNVV